MPSIYGLYDQAGTLRYIGKANDPSKRLKSHVRDARRLAKTPVHAWINEHGCPEMRVIERDCLDWREAERRLIAQARSRGDFLLNLAAGGDEPFCSPEVRRQNGHKAFANRGRVKPGEVFTAQMLVKESCDWMWTFAHKLRSERLIDRVKKRMAVHFLRDPQSFSEWSHHV